MEKTRNKTKKKRGVFVCSMNVHLLLIFLYTTISLSKLNVLFADSQHEQKKKLPARLSPPPPALFLFLITSFGFFFFFFLSFFVFRFGLIE